MESVWCRVRLVAKTDATFEQLLAPSTRLGVFVETTGPVESLGAAQKVCDYLDAENADPWLLLHVMGPEENGRFRLDDTQPNGEWLDVAASTVEAIGELIGRGDDRIVKLFVMGTVLLGVAIGQQCDRFWRMQLIHWRPPHGPYQLVLDMREFGDSK